MSYIADRSRLLQLREGAFINHKYVLVSATRPKNEYVVPLGEGGSSVVFLAYQVLLEQEVIPRALKFFVLSAALAQQYEECQVQTANTQNVRNEIIHLTSLQHTNILRATDAGTCEMEEGEVDFLVTDYIPGPTLNEVIACHGAKRCTPAAESVYQQIQQQPILILRMCDQICSAIEYLHSREIYHRDIAPKNILIHSQEGCRPILGDFTLGRQIHAGQGCDRTQLGGDMAYAPPAVHRHADHTLSAHQYQQLAQYWDIYGFAKSMLELDQLLSPNTDVAWRQPLRHYLRQAMKEEQAVSATALHRTIGSLIP